MNLNPKSGRAHDMFGDSDMKYQYSKRKQEKGKNVSFVL